MVQIKKDEMEKRLLDAARQEFLKNGFEGASIRNIVKVAETTIGNFYNYFENKEAIFSALVEDIYNGFAYVLANHNDIDNVETDLADMNATVYRQLISMQIEKVLHLLDNSFLLLIEKSGGTKYGNSKLELIEMMNQHFLIHIQEINPSYPYPEMGKVFALQLIEGAISILNNFESFDDKLNMLTELLLYSIIGIEGMLKGE